MESTYLQSELAIKVKMRSYIRLLVEGATFLPLMFCAPTVLTVLSALKA